MKNYSTLIWKCLFSGLFILTLTLSNAQIDGLDNGSGTPEDPYEIATYDELHALSKHAYTDTIDSLFIVLTDDIDAKASQEPKTFADTFFVIKCVGSMFFDGQGHTIDGLEFHNIGTETKLGLFGYIQDSSSIKNVRLTNLSAHLGGRGGIVIGQVQSKRLDIENVSVQGVSTTTAIPSGLVGSAQSGSLNIKDCYVELKMSTSDTENDRPAGAIIGRQKNTVVTIDKCVINTVSSINGIGTYDVINQGTASSNITISNVYYNVDKCLFGTTVESAATAAENAYSATAVNDADWGKEASFAGLDFTNVWSIVDGAPAITGIPSSIKDNYHTITNANVFVSNNQLVINNIQNITEVRIIDITGKSIMHSKASDNQINIENLQSGIYIVSVKTNSKYFSSKFIK